MWWAFFISPDANWTLFDSRPPGSTIKLDVLNIFTKRSAMRIGAIFPTVEILGGLRRGKRDVFLGPARKYQSAGVQHIEMTGDLFRVEPYDREYLRGEIEKLNVLAHGPHGITFGLHASCIGVNTGIHHELIREASVKTILEDWELTKSLDPKTITLHPNALAMIDAELKPKRGIARSYIIGRARENEERSIQELIKVIPQRRICYENYHEGDLKEYQVLIAKYDLGVCYDVGHHYAKLPSHLALEIFFREWGRGRVRNVHLHNLRVIDPPLPYGLARYIDHRPITDKEGLIDVKWYCYLLHHVGYDGAIILEEYHNKDIVGSIKFLSEIIRKIEHR